MVIRASNLSFAYGNHDIICDMSIHIPEKDFIALIGPNGCGKSTLVKLFLGLLQPRTGTISLFGTDVSKFKKWSLIGYVPQRYAIDKNFPATVRELFALKKAKRLKSLVSLLDIEGLLDKQFIELSGGQQQRVLIAFALLEHPQLLILDEPVAGVDLKSQKKFFDLLKKINRNGVTILLVTHDVGLVTKHAKHVLCLHGTTCVCGPAKDAAKLLKKAHGTDFEVLHHHA